MVAALTNRACFNYTKRKFNTQIAQFHLMCLDSGVTAWCCLSLIAGNLLAEWLEIRALGCITFALPFLIAGHCFTAMTSLNSFVRQV